MGNSHGRNAATNRRLQQAAAQAALSPVVRAYQAVERAEEQVRRANGAALGWAQRQQAAHQDYQLATAHTIGLAQRQQQYARRARAVVAAGRRQAPEEYQRYHQAYTEATAARARIDDLQRRAAPPGELDRLRALGAHGLHRRHSTARAPRRATAVWPRRHPCRADHAEA